MFVDTTTLTLTAGKGGNGVVAWRREKYIPKGGPTGGNGGRGGSISLIADNQILSLEAYRNKRILLAENGGCGGSNLRQGKAGKDLTLKLPCGTLIKDKHTGEVLFDLTDHGQTVVICQGGKPGKGNAHFKSSTNQAPNTCTPGTPGESKEVELELKLIADVGLVGFPNAGKSTFLSQAAYTRVKIGAYPFTTLFPNLAYVHYPDKSKLLIADIPGIIQDAHMNKGLGLAFLKHIERTSILVFLVDISGFEGRNPTEDFLTLRKEIAAYRQDLLDKPFLVGLNKIDLEESQEHIDSFYQNSGVDRDKIFLLSAKDNVGVRAFLDAIKTLILPPLS